MVDSADELRPEWFAGKRRVGLTAGASAPECWCSRVIERLAAGRGGGAQDGRHP
jgi:4-hydroxy-3-methylbut-2-enyl diphosphate reductase